MLGSGQQCRPCPCPGYPGTRHYHGSACHADEETNHIVCLCAPGYAGEGQTGTTLQDPSEGAEVPSALPRVPAGPRCDRCSPGYFGTPEMEGGVCRPCQCNNNIDTSDPGACDPHTGHCRRCLYHTAGPRCAQCQPGYFGNALQRSCRREWAGGCERTGSWGGVGLSPLPHTAAHHPQAVAVTRGERCLPTALLAPAAVTAPQEPAPAEPMWWAGAATAAHPTSGTWGGRGAVSLVDAIPRTPRTLPAMR